MDSLCSGHFKSINHFDKILISLDKRGMMKKTLVACNDNDVGVSSFTRNKEGSTDDEVNGWKLENNDTYASRIHTLD